MKRFTFHSIVANPPQLLPVEEVDPVGDAGYENDVKRHNRLMDWHKRYKRNQKMKMERDQTQSLRRIQRNTSRQNALLAEQMRRQEEERQVNWVKDLNGLTTYRKYEKTVPPGRDPDGTWEIKRFRPPPTPFCGCNWPNPIVPVIVYRVALPNGAPDYVLENNQNVNPLWIPL